MIIMQRLLLIFLGVGFASLVAAANLPPKNSYLANSLYALGHADSAQQDSLSVAGPVDKTRRLRDSEIDYVHVGPAFFGVYTSGPYADGKRVMWGNGLDRIVKIDHDTHQVLSTYYLPDADKRYLEAEAEAAIAYFDDNNEGLAAIYKSYQEAQKLQALSSVYTLLDHTNTYYIADKRGFISAYGDKEPGKRDSGIELKRRFDFPVAVTGYSMGINMTYDGWLVVVTEHGYLLALKPDFSDYRVGRLQHAEGAEEKATGRAGYGWVRNAPAIDAQGGIYIASQEYMHKVIWTGQGFSTTETDGAWAIPYDNTWGHGTGATPSLMGFGADEDNLVVITDGNPRMNLVLYWRNEIPADWQGLPGHDRRVAGIQPVTMGEQNLSEIQSEQSVVVAGYGALVVNNNPRNTPWYLPGRANTLLISFLGSNPAYQPFGVQKFEWDASARKLKADWVNNEVSSPSSVPIVSHATNMVYLIGARNNEWTLEAMDWDSGESTFHYVIGGQRYNVFFSGTLLDEAGRIHYGTPWGRVRLNPRLSPAAQLSEAN